MKKNVSGQHIGAELVATDGSAFTGSVTVYVTGDGGSQSVGTVSSGACDHKGNGFHEYAPAQAETNYDHIGFTFIGSGAIPATVQVYPTFPQTGDSFARLGAPAGASVSADIAAVKSDSAAILTDTAEIGAAGAGLTAITAKTDNLPSDPADESLVIAATDAIAALIGTPAVSVSDDIAAVKVDTAAIKTYADRTVVRGTVSATSPTTTGFTASALSPAGVDADQFKGRIIVFDNATTTTALRGQATDITANTAASLPAFTFSALTTAPQSGDTFSIL